MSKKSINTQATWLQQALIKLDLMTDEVYQKEVSEFFDTQPYLMGFLFNLEDEFAESTHELLLRASLAFYQALGSLGLQFEIVTPQMLEDIIEKKVAEFNAIDRTNPTFDEGVLFNKISSPASVKGILTFIDENARKEELEDATRNNLLLIISAIVEVLENAATIDDKKQSNA